MYPLHVVTPAMKHLKQAKQNSWQLFDKIAHRYDFINRVLSLGIDGLWRKQFIRNLPDSSNLTCLDLATGTADVALVLAADDRVQSVLATDLSEEMLAIAGTKVRKSAHHNKITVQVGDGVAIPSKDNYFDVVTVSFGLRNFGDYQRSLQNMHRVLTPGGRAMILEFSLPKNGVIRRVYLLYFRNILPVVGSVLSGHPNAYRYLNRTVEDFPYGEALADEIRKAGFHRVELTSLSLGIATMYVAYKD